MREKRTKAEFVAYTKRQIEMRATLDRFYNEVYLPTLQKFNGKVYNIRFIKALREKISEDVPMRVCERDNNEIEIRIGAIYSDSQSIYAPCVDNAEGRIDYNASLNSNIAKRLDKRAEYNAEYENAIERYDEYLAMARDLERRIDEYNKLSYVFRYNIESMPQVY